ncbi:Tn7-like element transposition protein TnsE [Paenibacillus sp. ACRRX]|uniref:Tn7-like element transposition protein TnsE n=1 Tax=Paenibacillus sp. ACRRX TaxID=2918206 RepID=UPI001EF60978|nr:Tn7-like element transposition protein TnsE [Paenibacillus sp. ACRRX]MCG7410822.1 Tn7-like element transposition protein TnsE [Paenibacillus sp. ACRRX]
MSYRTVKQGNWPFFKGELAQLIWIRSPIQRNGKQMIRAYFRANGVTKCIEVDWGTLPLLAIQHYYQDGNLMKAFSPDDSEIIEVTINPQSVRYSEKEWRIQGARDEDVSQSFTVTCEGEKYTLPLIEVIRSILAPNRFLLYQIFEPNSFPLYFHHKIEDQTIHFQFTSLYEFKYTRPEFLLHLAWLVSHPDIMQVFESIKPCYMNNGKLMFDWAFQQSITVKALVKPNSYGYTILRILSVLNKQLPFKEITFTHPKLNNHQRSNEPKKYILKNKSKYAENEEVELSEEFDGTTSDFDIVDMENQSHEYTLQPKITRIRKNVDKQRSFEDENTKVYYLDDEGKRSTADIGGHQIARALEHKPLHEIKVQGELDEFIQALQLLEKVQNIKSVRAHVDILPATGGERKFKYLNDGVTRRRYVWAEVVLHNGKLINVLEIERELYSLSTLFIHSESISEYKSVIQKILANLIHDQGSWLSKSLNSIRDMGIQISKLKHGLNKPENRSSTIIKHIMLIV